MPIAATTTTSTGTVVFSNSGAAADLTNGTLTEDTNTEITFDVLAASGGGAKTTLYSVDDGDVDVAYTGKPLSNNFADYNTDLLAKDALNNVETTANGGKFWIGNDAKVHYSAASLDLQHLGAGDTFTDTFEYTI